jgi:NADH-quinone oxidoreductase subunit L
MYLNTNFKINFDFFIDNIALSFAFLTITIAVFVYIFAFSYFRYEPLVDRLILLLNTFVISMVFLVTSGNFVMLFLGWEMIGLTSFFLINFWITRVGTLKAAFKAFSFNKLSDMSLFFAMLLVFNLTYNLDILTFISQVHLYEGFVINFCFIKIGYLELISLFLMLSAFIKSAQLGAHIWLPDSMEAPVPASALIHSATLVSAGIFLLLRFTVLFELSYITTCCIAIIGSITAFYGGFVSAYQSDTKRILAYSTISHCGFLMVMYTTGVVEYVLLYLYVHGFFKAAVFMCVGNVNRFSRNNQDFKRMGQYYKFLPFDCLVSFIGLINLSGLPFTFGFYIKHLLFVGLNMNYYIYYFVLVNCLLGAFTGLFYSYRLFYNVFFDFKKSRKILYLQASNSVLNSKFYSNINFSASFAILGLMFTSYAVSLFLIYVYLNVEQNFSNFSNFLVFSSFIDGINSSFNFLNNVSVLNWIVLFLGSAIIFTPWRTLVTRSKYIDSFFIFLVFSLWFYLFYFIIL